MLAVLGLILGVLVLAFAYLAYSGSTVVAGVPPVLRRQGDPLWLAGLALIGLALLLGFVGLVLNLDVRIVRILIGVVGLVLLGLAWPRAATPPVGR
jgi:hypothetical protein